MAAVGDDPRLREILCELKSLITVAERTSWTQTEARAIVEALRMGVPPAAGALALTVGRENVLARLSQDLDHVQYGKTRVLFLAGEYGMGKTHVLRVLQEYAHQRSFATTLVELSRRECPLHDLRLVYQKVVQNLRLRLDGSICNLELLLENWASRIRGLAERDLKIALGHLAQLDGDLQAALTTYFCDQRSARSPRAQQVLEWVMGAGLSRRERTAIGVSADISDRNAMAVLGSLGLMLRAAGLWGMVILLDEADVALSVEGAADRVRAARNLNALMRSSGSFRHCYVVYSVPPALFGRTDLVAGLKLQRESIVQLRPLDVGDLVLLAQKIRDMHLIAYAWRGAFRVRDTEIRRLAAALLRHTSLRSSVRSFVRLVVEVLDICHEHREQTPTSVAKGFAGGSSLAYGDAP